MPHQPSPLARRPPQQISIPPKGFVVINGQKHLVALTPYQQSSAIAPHQPQHQPIIQHTAPAPAAQYEVKRAQPQTFTFPSPLNMALAAITMLCFGIAVSMASIGLTAYSNSVNRTDRLQKLIYVEP